MGLPPSKRITLIKEIGSRLADEEYPLIDLTLNQYRLPTRDQWGESKEAYVLQMTSEASDDTLTDLAQHLGFQLDEAAKTRVEPVFWRTGMFRLFLSHLSEKRAVATNLQTVLLDYGISGFVAHNDIEPTAEWLIEIETALATCDALVALLHKDFHASKWTDQEVGFAMGRGVPVYTIRFGEDPYGFVGRFQAFNGGGKSADALARELFDAYRKNKQTQRKMSEVLVSLFEQSGSFAEAKARIGYLEELEVWEPSFATRLRAATKGNSQVSGSWGVPERVQKLLKARAAP